MAIKEPEDASLGSESTSAPTVAGSAGASSDKPSPPAGAGLASRPRGPLGRAPPAIILQGIAAAGITTDGGRAKLEGEIKSFYAERGFGFISCQKVFEMMRCDVYFTLNEVFDVEASQVEERVRKGVKCSFFFTLNKDSRPQARVVRLQQGAEDDDRSASRNAKFDKTDAEDKKYSGRIKSFNASKGYGFISCDETHARFNRDVFLHHSQLNGLKAGDEVHFRIFVDRTKADAQAKALDVQAVNGSSPATPAPANATEAAVKEPKVPTVPAVSNADKVDGTNPTASPTKHTMTELADIFVSGVTKPIEPVANVPVQQKAPSPSETGWTRYVTEESEYWWHCCNTEEWFMENEPGQWAEFVDTATSKKYWFHPDGRCFWSDED